jgi:hypothetical protein
MSPICLLAIITVIAAETFTPHTVTTNVITAINDFVAWWIRRSYLFILITNLTYYYSIELYSFSELFRYFKLRIGMKIFNFNFKYIPILFFVILNSAKCVEQEVIKTNKREILLLPGKCRGLWR